MAYCNFQIVGGAIFVKGEKCVNILNEILCCREVLAYTSYSTIFTNGTKPLKNHPIFIYFDDVKMIIPFNSASHISITMSVKIIAISHLFEFSLSNE